ncbi:MAG: hypothetical protein AAGI46_01445 [Planctomycetota bacterium]
MNPQDRHASSLEAIIFEAIAFTLSCSTSSCVRSIVQLDSQKRPRGVRINKDEVEVISLDLSPVASLFLVISWALDDISEANLTEHFVPITDCRQQWAVESPLALTEEIFHSHVRKRFDFHTSRRLLI